MPYVVDTSVGKIWAYSCALQGIGYPLPRDPKRESFAGSADPVQDILTLQKIMSLTEQYMAK